MGTWGTGIFDDDTARDVRESYLALLASTPNPADAERAILDALGSSLDDPDEGPVAWLALAATQWEYGQLSADVRDRALAAIDSGAALAAWNGQDRAAAQRRRTVQALRDKLNRPPPKSRRPRKPKHRAPPPGVSIDAPDARAKATVYQLTADPSARERTQVICEMEAADGRGGGHIAVLSCPWEAVTLRWVDADTLEVTHPAGALVHYPAPGLHNPQNSAFYFGRTIRIQYRLHEPPRLTPEQ